MAQIILDSNNNLIQGDFDNATLNNRTKLQTTTTNATTNVYVVPNGSSTSAGVSVANNSSLTNASKIVMATNGTTDTQIISGINGSGTYLPMSFYTNNTLGMQLSTAGVLTVTGGVTGSSLPAGSVIQVVSTTKTDTFSSSTTGSYLDITGMSVSITPTSASNKILVIFSGNAAGAVGTNGFNLQLVRGSTAICVGDTVSGKVSSSTGGATPDSNWSLPTSINYLDSPATTSSVTYKIQFNIGAGSFWFNRSQTDGSGAIRAASTITVMEIKG
jgi:hypothetical protein